MSRDESKPLAFGWVAAAYNISEGAWIDPTDACKLTGLTDHTLRYWANQGAISSINHGGKTHRRYLQPELEKVLEICKPFGRTSLYEVKKHLQTLMLNDP